MSKAEEFAYSKYPKDKKGVLYDLARNSIIQGYHQAEKDNELTWEDLKALDYLLDDVYAEYDVKMFDKKEYYQEVLKRFKNYKERKENGE